MSEPIVKHFGTAGHLCVSESCRFHLCTQVGNVLVSTVGDYVQPGVEGFADVGYGRKFETMVFSVGGEQCDCGCGAPRVDNWAEIECLGYNSRREANEGHAAIVDRYFKQQTKKET